MFVATQEVGYIFFTVLAPAHADLAHVYFSAEPNASVNVSDYYVSLVLERALWRTGNYSGAIGGRAAIKLSNGTEYESQAAQASVTARLTEAGVLGGDAYLHGTLTMLLAAKSSGEPLRAEVQFN